MHGSWRARKILVLFSAILILVAVAAVKPSHAWHAWGCVYCDVDQNKEIGPGDLPLPDVGVGISNTGGTFSTFDWTGADGCFEFALPDGPDSYEESLDPASLPSDVIFVDPSLNLHPFTLTNSVVGDERHWLVDSAICRSEGLGCRMTGGGNDTAGSTVSGAWDGTLAEGKQKAFNGGFDRYTFGGQVGANTGSQPQPKGEWTHHQQSGPDGSFIFHAGTASAPPGTEIDVIICSDPGYCFPARPAPTKQIDFAGVGTFKNIRNPSAPLMGVVPGETYHWFEVHVEDLGEPGNEPKGVDKKNIFCADGGSGTDAFADPPVFINAGSCGCADFYRIRIYQAFDPQTDPPNKTDVIYEVSGYIDGGNLQIHPPTGFDLK